MLIVVMAGELPPAMTFSSYWVNPAVPNNARRWKTDRGNRQEARLIRSGMGSAAG